MTTRNELIEALRLRYHSAAFSNRIKILDQFMALTCYHRKHVIPPGAVEGLITLPLPSTCFFSGSLTDFGPNGRGASPGTAGAVH